MVEALVRGAQPHSRAVAGSRRLVRDRRQLQKAGGRPMEAEAFLRGVSLSRGARLP
jgi:hypothetical protein